MLGLKLKLNRVSKGGHRMTLGKSNGMNDNHLKNVNMMFQ